MNRKKLGLILTVRNAVEKAKLRKDLSIVRVNYKSKELLPHCNTDDADSFHEDADGNGFSKGIK
ncbi:hypothetical protein B0A71_04920 [Flavobacterium tructae]|uniref:Uncharacterized protein n=1 Tax=Flavobacterium tructae TaxID=1114873 RepID=A0A1S1JAQ1_9FLAO|nr:hypothetical protein BHE19_03745 [Flavobacterium tructae]OXB20942.1 hypothetical protein B0A71_04920 [Flavobacterium tructae]